MRDESGIDRMSAGTVERRMRGSGDLAWLIVVVVSFSVFTWTLTDYLRGEFDAWRLANQLAVEVTEADRLRQEQRQLRVEREVRIGDAALPVLGRELGLEPVSPERVVRMGEP